MFQATTAVSKILRLKKRKKVIQGGTSAGKTMAILAVLIDRCTKNPGLEVSIVSESIPHLRRGALKDFIKIMQSTGRWIDANYNKTLLTYTFSNGAYMEFFSADQEERLRGARRNVLYINEANNIPFESYYQLAIRTSGDIFIDFNPTHEFWEHTEILPGDDAELLILTYNDNEALPDTIKADIEMAREKAKTSDYWTNWWKVYGLGQLGALQGVVFDNWGIVDAIPDDAEFLGCGLDFGYTNHPSALVGVYRFDNKYYYDELIYQRGLTNPAIAAMIKQFEIREPIYADSAEPKSIAEIEEFGIFILPTVKGADSVRDGIQIMQQEKFFVTSGSTNMIKELRNYVWLVTKDGRKTNTPVDAFNHTADAVRYWHLSNAHGNGSTEFSVY